MRPHSQSRNKLLHAVAAIAATGAVAFACRALPVNATTTGLLFLLLVLVVASGWGLYPAIAASLSATLLFNFYFLPPLGALTIADPQNWIALVAFLITSVISSELSNRARTQAEVAVEQRREVERLYALSRAVLLDSGENALGATITQQIAGAFGFESVLFYDVRTHKPWSAGPKDLNITASELQNVRETGVLCDGSGATPVRLGNKTVGVLAIRGDVGQTALEAIANLIAITVERAESQEAASQARAARKNEELKSSILDALAHEFKTPLTSIKAASTAMLSRLPVQPESHRELLTIIDEEADRLTNLVTEAIQASHIEAGRVKLTRVSTDIRTLIDSVITQLRPRLDGRVVESHGDAALPAVMVDRELMELAVRQLVDNALKYSRPGTPILLRAAAADGSMKISVSDSGPGIPKHEQQKIFEKFYRGESIRSMLPGSGLGLNIVKEIVHAHSGTIGVQSNPNMGTTFTIDLPVSSEVRG